MDKDNFIHIANKYGKDEIPFFFIIDYGLSKFILHKLDEIQSSNILFSISEIKNHKEENVDIGSYTFNKVPIDFSEYNKSFNNVLDNLNRGYSYLTNLTCETPISTDLSLKDIFHSAKAKYKLWYNDEFVVFSPETFIKIENNIIYSFPMKGTINASIPNAENTILNNEKEKAEHATIVDLLRNDLSRVASNVQVDNYRYIDKVKTHDGELLQVSSQISGKLDDDFKTKLGSIILEMLPAGSICGAPKPATLDIINNSETHNRNFYTGIMGIFDGKNLDSGVMIRYIEKRNSKLFFKSGGGITSQSIAEEEYNEMIQKVYLPF